VSQVGPSTIGRLKAIFWAESGRLRVPRMLTSDKIQTTRIGPPLWVSAAVYVLLSVLMTWPLITQLGTHFPSPDTDIFNAYWANWWFRHALESGQNPYVTDYLLYPVGFDVIAFGFSPVLALMWLPLSWVLTDLAAFNLVLLVTIVLTCLAMDQLVRYLTGNGWAGLVAGITFGFAPSLVAERLPHPSKAALFWIPWALLVLTRLVREARIRDAFLLAALMGLAFLTLPQVGIFVVMSCAVYFAGLLAVERKRWHRLAVHRLLLASLLSLLVLTPVLIYAWQSLMQPGAGYLLEWGAEIAQTDLLAYVVPPEQHPLLGSLQAVVDGRRYVLEGQYWVYLGILPILLVLYAAISHPRVALPWLLMGSVFFILALGPYLRLGGQVYPAIRLPYSLATKLFSATGLNTPNRFNMVLAAATSVLVGLACAHLYARFGRLWPIGLAGLLIVGEYLIAPLPTMLPPPASAFYEQMAADGEDYAIVDLPLTRAAGEVHRYYQTIHQKPIVGGWIKRVPSSAFGFVNNSPLLASWIADDQVATVWSLDSALAQLAEANVRYVVLHKDQLTSVPESMRILLGTVRPVYQDAQIMVLPTEIGSAQAYNVAHWFGAGVGLIGPTAFLQVPEGGGTSVLSASVCWLSDGEGDAVDQYQIALTGPDGVRVRDETRYISGSSQGLTCESHDFEVEPDFRTGEYALEITVFSGGHPLGTYSTTLGILRLPSAGEETLLAMGSPCYIPFDTDIELLGYNVMDGEGFVWIDLFWRSTASVQRTYARAIDFLDPATGQSIAGSQGQIQKHEWNEGERFQERILIWLDKDLQDDAVLSVELDGQRVTDGCRADLLVEEYADTLPPSVQAYVSPVSPEGPGAMDPLPLHPGLKGYDGRACLVVPRQAMVDTVYMIVPEQDPDSLNLLSSYFPAGEVVAEGPLQNGQPSLVVFEVPAGSTAGIAPSHQTDVGWGGKIKLLGYDLDATSYVPGDSAQLALYYETLEAMDADYTLFVHLVSSEDSASPKPIWGQSDSEPCQRSYRTSEWIPGEIIRDKVVITVASDTPPGNYQLEVGFYLLETMTRVPAVDAAGSSIPEDAVPLRALTVDSVE
jgi:hypothetical protein